MEQRPLQNRCLSSVQLSRLSVRRAASYRRASSLVHYTRLPSLQNGTLAAMMHGLPVYSALLAGPSRLGRAIRLPELTRCCEACGAAGSSCNCLASWLRGCSARNPISRGHSRMQPQIPMRTRTINTITQRSTDAYWAGLSDWASTGLLFMQ